MDNEALEKTPKKLTKMKLRFILPPLIFLGLLLIIMILPIKTANSGQKIKFGVSFSPAYAEELDLDWKQTYTKMLDTLNIKNLRIPTYWKDLESNPGQFNFQSPDFMLDGAKAHGIQVLLVVGMKQPRWPECQPPNWAYSLSLKERQDKTLEIVQKVIERYRDRGEIWGWQVENEPLFKFGVHCDIPDVNFLQKEVSLVKKLNPGRPVIITDSGEWDLWIDPMRLSDIFGTTMYRSTKNPLLGYIPLPFPKNYYVLKSELIRKFFAPKNQKTIISELQAEPWSDRSLTQTPLDIQLQNFSLNDFEGNVDFAKSTGFDKIYLWGVEWWFYMATQGHPEYLNFAKTLFKN